VALPAKIFMSVTFDSSEIFDINSRLNIVKKLLSNIRRLNFSTYIGYKTNNITMASKLSLQLSLTFYMCIGSFATLLANGEVLVPCATKELTPLGSFACMANASV
jgi:hypothetical protein